MLRSQHHRAEVDLLLGAQRLQRRPSFGQRLWMLCDSLCAAAVLSHLPPAAAAVANPVLPLVVAVLCLLRLVVAFLLVPADGWPPAVRSTDAAPPQSAALPPPFLSPGSAYCSSRVAAAPVHTDLRLGSAAAAGDPVGDLNHRYPAAAASTISRIVRGVWASAH